MPRTGTPLAFATLACASSCRTMQTKKSTAVIRESAQTAADDQPGLTAENWLASESAISHAMMNQL